MENNLWVAAEDELASELSFTAPTVMILVHEASLQPILPGSEVVFTNKHLANTLPYGCKLFSATPKGDEVKIADRNGEHFFTDRTSLIGAVWMTDQELVDAFTSDGMPEDLAEDMVAEAIDMLGKYPYTHN